MNSKLIRLICLVTLVKEYLCESILKHSNEVDFGNYFTWALCDIGAFATAFDTMTDIEEKNFSDEQGLTGLTLYCSAKNGTEIGPIKSYNLDTTSMPWKGKNSCPRGEYLSGFRMRVQPKAGLFGDDTGANDIEMICNNKTIFSGKGNNRGDWSEWVNCPAGQFIYGLRTRAESSFTADKVGIAGVEMMCGNITGEGRTTEDPNLFTAIFTDLFVNDNVTYGPFTNNTFRDFSRNNFNASFNNSGVDNSFFETSSPRSNSDKNGISFPGQ